MLEKWDAGCKRCQAIAVGIGTPREKRGVQRFPTEPLVHPHEQRVDDKGDVSAGTHLLCPQDFLPQRGEPMVFTDGLSLSRAPKRRDLVFLRGEMKKTCLFLNK